MTKKYFCEKCLKIIQRKELPWCLECRKNKLEELKVGNLKPNNNMNYKLQETPVETEVETDPEKEESTDEDEEDEE